MNKQKIHIFGICGTFMGGLAAIARTLNFKVSGSDKNVYPPMSTQLENLGIRMHKGYDDTVLQEDYDQVIIGNVMTRGMPVIESLLNSNQYYTSGPQWLGDHLLRNKKVFAVAGTHGKTTTSSMLAWIFEDNNQNPGFLIGGVANNFQISARNTNSQSFIIEADEYDSAFFDKRSKFIHYHADVAILNNLEYDHADIFKNLDAIKTQFHHLIRTIPNKGTIVVNNEDKNLKDVLTMGCWSQVVRFGLDNTADIWAIPEKPDYSKFTIFSGQDSITLQWTLTGKHNMLNAIAAVAAANIQNISLSQSVKSLMSFQGIKRRMEFIGEMQDIKIYDDFAHHPTAIATTIDGVKKQIGEKQLIAVFEPRSNSMRVGTHAQYLPKAVKQADIAIVMNYPNLKWDKITLNELKAQGVLLIESTDELMRTLLKKCKANTTVVFMSNGSFDNSPRLFLQKLKHKLQATPK